MKKTTTTFVCCLVSFGLMSAAPASAQSLYEYCRDEASRITGYYGERPRGYDRRGEVARNAATGAALGAIFGKKGKKGKAAKEGAAIGALIGAIKKGSRRDKQRRARQEYNYEVDRCMRDRAGPSDYDDDRYRDRRQYRDDRRN